MSVLSQVLQSQGQQNSCKTVWYFLVWVLDSGNEWCCTAAESHIQKARAFWGDQRQNTVDFVFLLCLFDCAGQKKCAI